MHDQEPPQRTTTPVSPEEARGVAADADPNPAAVDRALASWLLGYEVDETGIYLPFGDRSAGPFATFWTAHEEAALVLLDDVLRYGLVAATLSVRLGWVGTWFCRLENSDRVVVEAHGPTRARAIALAILRLALCAEEELRVILTVGRGSPGGA